MSRIGRAPINVPANVTVTVAAGNEVTVKGPLGTLSHTFADCVSFAQEGAVLTVSRASDEAEHRALHGLSRTLLNNMVVGVTTGYAKTLQINGVGYRAEKQGKRLVLSLGYSHPVYFEEGNGITFELPDNTTIVVKGIDKQVVGQIAAEIRAKRPPEPYLGKGIRYVGEKIRRKAGKTGK
ncbi:MAG: 50S ribosomal protein L6 [Clostridia bacterium]|nr:50S ribosomal protein L6 [Clostridia bacterium]